MTKICHPNRMGKVVLSLGNATRLINANQFQFKPFINNISAFNKHQINANVINVRSFSISTSKPFNSSNQLFKEKKHSLVIGIRKEDKNRWERRVVLLPDHVESLIKFHGATVLIEPSSKRVIPDSAYLNAGAKLCKNVAEEADIILGVKEIPLQNLKPEKTYLFFSHTAKGQPSGTSTLKDVINKKIRLIDYELLVDDKQQRLVQFSKFAGYAGMIDILHGLGQRLLVKGYGSPFLAIGMSYMYRCIDDGRLDVTRTGLIINTEGLPKDLGPMVFTFVGNGNVVKGAKHIFNCLPHEFVKPEDLPNLVKRKDFDNKKVYLCHVKSEDYMIGKDGSAYNKDAYYSDPTKFKSVFHEKFLPYTSVLINGIFWEPKCPRLVTSQQIKDLKENDNLRLLAIADITCDLGGPIDFVKHATTIDKPFFIYNPLTGKNSENIEDDGILINSVDNLPAELPLEASAHFSSSLFPYVTELVKGNFAHPVLSRATISENGAFTDKFKHLYNYINNDKHASSIDSDTTTKATSVSHVTKQVQQVRAHQTSSRTFGQVRFYSSSPRPIGEKVLLLGSGMVSGPLVDYLVRKPNQKITIASNNHKEAAAVAKGRSQVTVKDLNVNDKDVLGNLIADHDIVVSFIPATLHPIVAEQCIAKGKHLVTASYISPKMQELDQAAKQAGVSILNEIGLDPGIDHMSAMKMIHKFQNNNERIVGFVSWCGGLPNPDCTVNPFQYKFSWNPKGVLLASQNSAVFKSGKVYEVPGHQLLDIAMPVNVSDYDLEGLPNRDSLKYQKIYGLPDLEDMHTMFRGTLRYKGFSKVLRAFRDLGYLSQDIVPELKSGNMKWMDIADKFRGDNMSKEGRERYEYLSDLIADNKDVFDWLGMSDPNNFAPKSDSPIDAFSHLLMDKLKYLPGEKDLVLMQHEFETVSPDGTYNQYLSYLNKVGVPNGDSAMATTVALPAAMGVQRILDGVITRKGVFAPLTPDIYEPILEELNNNGITFEEKEIRNLKKGSN